MTPNTRVAGEEPGMLIQRFDWAGTSVGERSAWSHSLRVSVDSMLTSAMPMLLMWGPQHVVFYNSACAAILGDRHPGAMGGTAQIIWPEFWDRFVPLLQAANDGRPQTVRDAHFMLDSKNPAKEIWLDLFYAPVADEHGKTGGVMCAMIDTTDRIRSQQESERFAAALREANHTLEAERQSVMAANRRLANESGFLRELFQQAPGFVAVLRGPEHVFEVANPSYQRLLGNRELIGKPVRESVPEAVSHGLVQVLDQVYSSGEPFVGKNIKVALQITPGKPFEQRILDFVYQPIKNAAGAVEGIFVEGMDMTEQMINIDRLRVAQQAGGVGTFEWFPERDEIVISDEYRRIWGFPPDLAVSPKTIVDTVDPRDRRAVGPALWRQQDNPLAYAEYRITRHSDGQQRWIARRGEVIQQEAPLGPRYVGAVTDITERKRVEDELRASIAERRAAEERLQELNETLEQRVEREVAARGKAEETLRYMQKMDAIGQLTGGVAHDFNNVLQIISANLQLLQPNLEREQVAQRRIDTAITAVERGARLSSHLLAFARRQPLRPEVLNLQRRLGEMEELWQRALGVTVVVETEVADGLWNTLVDPDQLETVLLNVAINARDAMNGVGTLTIKVENVQLDTSRLLNEAEVPPGDYLLLSIRDTGSGMTPEVAARAFEPFFTTKAEGEGTGLGLSMAYGFVRQSQGFIALSSEAGAGTTVRIYLPRSHEEESAPKLAPTGPLLGGHETILVVEDDPDVAASVIDMLKNLGYQILTATNAADALDIVRSDAVIDLLFTDVVMPGPMRSPDMAREAKLLRPELPVLFTSGYTQDAFVNGGRLDPGLQLISKPYRIEELGRKIRRMLPGQPKALSPVPAVAPAESAPAESAPAESAPATLTVARILVVEDNVDAQFLVCEMLSALGHEAEGAGDADLALALLAKNHFDLLFTDVNLPGMSGVDLARKVVAEYPQMKIVFASGYGAGTSKHVDFPSVSLPKPYDMDQLEAALKSLGIIST